MSTVEKHIEIKVPVSVAYNQWTQFEKFPEFMEGIEEVKQLTDKTLYWSAEIGNKDKEWNAEITEQIPDQRIAWKSTTGARNDGVVWFTSIDSNTTRVNVEMTYEPEGIVENIGSALGIFSNRVEGDLERFKDFIEYRGNETGAWRGKIENGQVMHDKFNSSSSSLNNTMSSNNTDKMIDANNLNSPYYSHNNVNSEKGSTIGTPTGDITGNHTGANSLGANSTQKPLDTYNSNISSGSNVSSDNMNYIKESVDNSKELGSSASNTTSSVNPANSFKSGESLNATKGSLLDDDGEIDKKGSRSI